VTIRRRLVLMSVATFVLVLVAAGAGVLGLLRNSLVNDVDTTLLERRASLTRLIDLVSIELLGGFATERSQLGGSDLAFIALAPDGSVIASAPSGPPDEPDPLPALDPAALDVLRTSDEPVTVGGGADGYRATGLPLAADGTVLVLAQPLDAIARTMRLVLLILLVVGACASVILAATLTALIRRELRPIDAMAVSADRITEGDLSRRVAVDRPSNEVGRLGAALNSMLARIEDAVAAKTESENKMRRFVADASHELRTPLTSIRGYAELYRAGADSPDDVVRSFDRIEREARRMGGLVDDLVLLARLDQERPFTRQEVDLAVVAREAVADARAIEPDRVVTTHIGSGRMVVAGDADRMRQVVTNLLANVRTHTEPGTPATVRVKRVGDQVVIAVADTGPGMEPEDAEQAFERFYQANPDRTTPGSGLGLSIVRSIVEQHGGTAELHSVVGAGTTVTFHIPAA
jgi:two-component system, OmpR family, sensor kinase